MGNYQENNNKKIITKRFIKTAKHLLGLSFLSLIYPLSGLSQVVHDENEKPINVLSLYGGVSFGILQDANFSPLRYNLKASSFSLEYQRRSSNSLINLDVGAGFGSVNTDVSSFFKSDYLRATIGFDYLKKIGSTKTKYDWFIGGRYASQVQLVDWFNLESFSYTANHGIGVKGYVMRQLNSQFRIGVGLYMPVLSLLVRPPYNGLDETVIANQDNTLKLITNGKLATFDKYFQTDGTVNISYAVNERFGITAQNLFRYINVPQTNRFEQFQYTLLFGLQYHF